MESAETSLAAERSELFERLGGRPFMSKKLGTPVSTIANWVSGIPAIRIPDIADLAKSQGVSISTDRLMALSTARRKGG